MEKSRIKDILRENLMGKLTETQPKEAPSEANDDSFNKDYSEVQRKLDGTLFKASQVMDAAGLGNSSNATDRSLFSKKLRKAKNDEGGTYLFNVEDLAKIIKVINNPSPYLSHKS